MVTRRMFLAHAAALGACFVVPWKSAGATEPASRALWDACGSYPWTEEGNGRQLFYILFEPMCPYARQQYVTTRALLSTCKFRWIAFPSRATASKGASARLAITRSQQDLADIMNHGADLFIGYEPEWKELMSTRPDIQILERQIYPFMRSYGRGGVASPSSVFMTSAGRYRFVRGAWTLAHFKEFEK